MQREKIDFMHSMDSIDKNGTIHKAKMAGIIYDLVEDKISNLKIEAMKFGSDNSELVQINKFSENLKELSKNILELQDSVEGLDRRIQKIEDKFDKIEVKKPTLKIKSDRDKD